MPMEIARTTLADKAEAGTGRRTRRLSHEVASLRVDAGEGLVRRSRVLPRRRSPVLVAGMATDLEGRHSAHQTVDERNDDSCVDADL